MHVFRLTLIAVVFVLSGCASVLSSAATGLADNLSAAILNQDDPETVRAGAPSYLLLIDSFIEGDPENADVLAAGANLYASYGAVFAKNPQRAQRLTSRARRYALKAMCVEYEASCDWHSMSYNAFVETLPGIRENQSEYLYTYGLSTLAFLRAHSDDWDSLAFLPQVEALFSRYLELAGDNVAPEVHTYMGILLTLRPPALGGKPDQAQEHFERAIAMTNGTDLSAKVEYARSYAKLLYERELHDRLLNEVLQADPYVDGRTLANVMAQEDARVLLAEADDYF